MRLGALGLLCALSVVACTGSERVRPMEGEMDAAGSAGAPAQGEAGTSGDTAGAGAASTSGSAGVSGGGTGSGGTPETAGTAGQGTTAGISGAAGTEGAAGSEGSTAGSKGAAGSSGAGGATSADAGASGAAGTGAEVTYTNLIGGNLTFYCGGCHSGGDTQNGFSVATYAGVTAHVSGATSGCPQLDASKARVVPGKPLNSLIYIKMSETSPPAGCGAHMPSMGNTVPANQQQIIYDWIMAGAKE
jgi:hypothetical protein